MLLLQIGYHPWSFPALDKEGIVREKVTTSPQHAHPAPNEILRDVFLNPEGLAGQKYSDGTRTHLPPLCGQSQRKMSRFL